LAKAGIDVSVGIAPVLPGFSDSVESIDRVVRAARDAGARNVWTRVLYLPPGTREHFLAQLGRDWPDHVPELESLYRGRTYAPKELDARVGRVLRERRTAAGFREAPPFRAPRPIAATGRALPVVEQRELGLVAAG
jgi:DNA repair photolyase